MRQLNPSLQRVLEAMPVSIVISDFKTGEITWVNSRNLDLAGATSPDQIVGHSLLEFLHPEQHAVALRDVAAVAAGASPPPVTYMLRRLDGGSADVQISSIPIRLEGETAMLSVCADVTDLERSRRSLKESEERYRELVEASLDGVVVVAGREEIAYVNPALWQALGASSAEQITKRSMYGYIHPDHHPDVRLGRKHVLETGEPFPPTPTVLLRVDGSEIPVTAQTTRVHWQGETATQTVLHFLSEES